MTVPRLPESIAADPLVIRRWGLDDAERMTQMITASLDHLRPWMAWARREPLDARTRTRQIRSWDRYWESGAGAVYGVFLGAGTIGGCALHRRDDDLEIGYWLAAGATGAGHATRIAAALTRTACNVPGVTSARINHAADNTTSAAVATRLGYSPAQSDVAGVTAWRHACGAEVGA